MAFAIRFMLAFLAPDLVKAAVEGRLPRDMEVARLCDLPATSPRQHEIPSLSKLYIRCNSNAFAGGPANLRGSPSYHEESEQNGLR